MTLEAIRHGGWVLLGMLALTVVAWSLWTGKAATKIGRPNSMGIVRVYRRETEPGAYWAWIILIAGIAILSIGYGISQLIQFYR
jgi:hypothetical protein